MATIQTDVSPEWRRAGRKLGYGIAVVINVVMLIVVQNIVVWDWLPFLTDEFAGVVPLISVSLAASIVANLIYLVNDRLWFKAIGQIGVNLFSILATYQLFRVFPFDFSTYAFNWGFLVRVILVLTMVGAGIGMLTEMYRLISYERETDAGKGSS